MSLLITILLVSVILITVVSFTSYLPIGLVDMIPFIKPRKDFKHESAGKAPDYSSGKSWFLFSIDDASHKDADVFFVHRTTFLSAGAWNGSINGFLQNITDMAYSVNIQTEIFRDVARIFAPKYRQATLFSFYDKNDNGEKALDLAYQDVKNAFLYYLKYKNKNRPIILVGHSQGTFHLERLMKEFFDNDELLRERLVCAYLASMPIKKNLFRNIPASENAGDTCCYLSWSTFGVHAYPLYFKGQYDDALCTNPLTWKNNDTKVISKEFHKGSVTFYFNVHTKRKVSAYVEKGVVHISNPGLGFFRLRKKDYVASDFHIFYGNIKENVKIRVKNYILKKQCLENTI